MADALGNAGYVIFGGGGGGTGGDYMFANLADLDSVITEWTAIREAIQMDGLNLSVASQQIYSPADDLMSKGQSETLVESLDKAQAHNDSMFAYADSYVDKLTAARDRYVADEAANVVRMRGVDEG